MIESSSPIDLVLALVRVVNGEAPRLAASEILDPMVEIRMDSTGYCGIDAWYKWVHSIRNCGRVADLRTLRCPRPVACLPVGPVDGNDPSAADT